jgi:large conductance mechanosensitive channel
VIIGGAFAPVVGSMVGDVIMPIVSLAVGKVDFSNLYLPLSDAGIQAMKDAITNHSAVPSLVEAKKLGAVLAYGNLINQFVNFLFLMMGVFVLIKIVNTLKKPEPAPLAPAEPPAPPADVVLLTEIRDLLKK